MFLVNMKIYTLKSEEFWTFCLLYRFRAIVVDLVI